MAVAGAPYTPTQANALLNEVWSRNLENAVYERAMFVPTIKEHERLYNKLHVRKLKPLTRQSLGVGADGTGLTYAGNTEVDVTLTPAATYCAVAFAKHTLCRMDLSPQGAFRENIEMAMEEGIDIDGMLDVSTLTNYFGDGGGDTTIPMWRYCVGQLRRTAKSKAIPGERLIRAIFHTSQYDDLMAIPELTNAEVRGDKENPLVKGIYVKAIGCDVMISGNVYVDPTSQAAYNCLYVEEAFGKAWNQRLTVEASTVELQDRVISWCDWGHNVVHNDRAFVVRTKSQ